MARHKVKRGRFFDTKAEPRAGGARCLGRLGETAFEGVFASSIEQIYLARAAFMESAQHALGLMLLCLTPAIAWLGLLASRDEPMSRPLVILVGASATALSALPLMLSSLWKQKLLVSYDLYAAACVHAESIAKELCLRPYTHLWLETVEDCRKRTGVFLNKNPADMDTCTDPDAHVVQKDSGKPFEAHLHFVAHGTPDFDRWGKHLARSPATNAEVVAVWRAQSRSLFAYYTRVFRYASVAIPIAVGLLTLAICMFDGQLWLARAAMCEGCAR